MKSCGSVETHFEKRAMTNDKPDPVNPTGRRDRAARQLSTTAYHEAGHAVADWKLGFKIRQVTIVPKGGAAGSVTGLKTLRISYGGGVKGESIGRYHDRRTACRRGSTASIQAARRQKYQLASDYTAAANFLLSLHGEEKERDCAVKYLRARTRNFINNTINWRIIEDLAKALLERRTLTGEEVNDVLRASQRTQMEERNARKK
jgi:hypothetical protein